MYKAMDVALYIINYLSSDNYSVSNLKLQKLLYFVQGFFLCIKNQPCFNEEIEAWDFGPVVPEVYHQYKFFGSNGIPVTDYYEYVEYDGHDMISFKKRKLSEISFSEIDKNILNMVLNRLKSYSATALVNITHSQDPWKKVYLTGCKHLIITKESIQKYFEDQYKNETGK